jgi:hypothetical protein
MNVDLAEQLASLRKEFGALKKAVAGRSSDFYEDAGDSFGVSLRCLPPHRSRIS